MVDDPIELARRDDVPTVAVRPRLCVDEAIVMFGCIAKLYGQRLSVSNGLEMDLRTGAPRFGPTSTVLLGG